MHSRSLAVIVQQRHPRHGIHPSRCSRSCGSHRRLSDLPQRNAFDWFDRLLEEVFTARRLGRWQRLIKADVGRRCVRPVVGWHRGQRASSVLCAGRPRRRPAGLPVVIHRRRFWRPCTVSWRCCVGRLSGGRWRSFLARSRHVYVITGSWTWFIQPRTGEVQKTGVIFCQLETLILHTTVKIKGVIYSSRFSSHSFQYFAKRLAGKSVSEITHFVSGGSKILTQSSLSFFQPIKPTEFCNAWPVRCHTYCTVNFPPTDRHRLSTGTKLYIYTAWRQKLKGEKNFPTVIHWRTHDIILRVNSCEWMNKYYKILASAASKQTHSFNYDLHLYSLMPIL